MSEISALGASAKIGRYFSVVSMLPAIVFTLYVYLLVQATAWFGPVRWSRVAEFHPQELLVLGLSSLVLALAVNPLQFPLIQLFEGYWGTSALAVELATVRAAHHRRRLQRLEDAANETVADDPYAAPATLRTAFRAAEGERLRLSYPESRRVLPTRLGNVLRRYEDAIKRPYGLDPLVAVPRLAMVAGQPEAAYVENQRLQLELAVRTTLLALVATPVTVALMWRSGGWLLLAAFPYAIAFLAYRGAVALAHEYGTSLAVLTDLTRFALYERLHLPHPPDTLAERRTNKDLMELFALRDSTTMPYIMPEEGAVGGERTSPAGAE